VSPETAPPGGAVAMSGETARPAAPSPTTNPNHAR
jgi:hypothetical protein